MPKKNLGVDIGSSGVRIAEITRRGNHAWLTNYGHTSLPQKINTNLASDRECQLVQKAINEICRRARFSTDKAYSTIPGCYTANQTFHFDQQTAKEVIESWVKDNLPTKHLGQDVLIKWQKIHPSTKKGCQTIQASATNKDIIERYQNIFRNTYLNLQDLETNYHALGRSLAGHDHRPTMIIDMGDKYTDVTITQHGHPIITKSLEFGGEQITAALAKHLNIDQDQAEQFKKDRQVAGLLDKDCPLIASVRAELRDLLAKALRKKIKLDKIIVSGGCAGDQELVTWLEKSLGVKVYPGNPWSRVVYQEDIKPLLAEITHYFPTAVGVAMKGLE
ncbi:MAG: pilus assembly protein PilM [Parcubacteria group bacterium]|nr:pilus assembly protein PilM [Parcubacteria group bacterium]